ncbi:L-aspartate oxidase, partial [Clostridium sp.]|uniref:L-aspartate oxidase n=1 Tax=Clostridium sp. TaxID=1506 RepID=UPI00257ED1EC
MVREENYDVVIVGCGVGGLYTALNLPSEGRILMICKEDIESCDSMLAQGGICVLRDETDYDAYFEDTMRAGHYENRKESVDIMIRSSRDVINNLLKLGVGFDKNPDGSLKYTKEGAHSQPRICFHEDITGKEITTTLQTRVKELPNVEIREYTVMTDILVENGICTGILAKNAAGDILKLHAKDTVLATGGIGGLYKHSTNFPSLTGDGLDVAKKHGVRLEHLDYVQIHPTSLYSKKPGRSFLISESTRGEGAVLLNGKGERFVDELLPRDVVTQAIEKEMEKEGSDHVWLSFKAVPEETIRNHFPHIYEECLKEGYDITKEPAPVVPAQHYFMGGIYVDHFSETTMDHLYAVGETSCNGVHGRLTFKQALAKSCNATFAQIAIELGPEKLASTVETLGLTSRVTVSNKLNSEQGRFFLEKSDPDDYVGWTGIGQGDTL